MELIVDILKEKTIMYLNEIETIQTRATNNVMFKHCINIK